MADGLNADRVDGKNAADIVSDAQAQNRFAQITAAGKTGATRGVDSAAHESTGVYRVAFTSDISNCASSATVVEDGTQPGFATVQPVDAQTLRVRVRQAAADNPLADRGFHLTVIC